MSILCADGVERSLLFLQAYNTQYVCRMLGLVGELVEMGIRSWDDVVRLTDDDNAVDTLGEGAVALADAIHYFN